MALDQEMEEIGRMWAIAKKDLSRLAKKKVRACVLLKTVNKGLMNMFILLQF